MALFQAEKQLSDASLALKQNRSMLHGLYARYAVANARLLQGMDTLWRAQRRRQALAEVIAELS